MAYDYVKLGAILKHSRYSDNVIVASIKPDSSYPVRIIELSTGDKNSYKYSDFDPYVVIKINKTSYNCTLTVTRFDAPVKTGTLVLADEPLTLHFEFGHYNNLIKCATDRLTQHLQGKDHLDALEKQGDSIMPETLILEDVEVELSIPDGDIREQYSTIVGTMSDLTKKINETFSLGDTKEIAAAFLEAKEKITALAGTAPGKVSSFMSKYVSKIPGGKTLMASVSDTMSENSSVQKNINFLFGVIHDKYEKLVNVGEGLQNAKGHMIAQINALEIIAKQSSKDVAAYVSQVDVPIRILMLDTQIKASIEKYKARLIKIDGSITACQTTILALGKDLPSLKTDLTDEMAIGNLLNSVDDYQKMYAEIANLVANVTETTAEKTFNVIENLLQMQINDTHTIDYLATSSARTKKFGAMIADKSEKLYNKAYKDAKFISEITSGNSIEHTKATIKKLSA